MKIIIHTLCALGWCTAAFAQHYQVDTLYKTGPLDNRVNVVILGDGFTAQEMPQFADEARKFSDFLRAFDPYDRYRDYFNFFAIRTPSRESGVTNPGTASDAYPDQPIEVKDTFFGVSFGEYNHRLVKITKNDVFAELMATHFPMHDLVIVLVNSKYYGGSGGGIAIYTLQEQADRVGVHEVGHTLGQLADEYWFSGGEAANRTADNNPYTIKWKNWLKTPPIGIYQHGTSDGAEHWYKPAHGTCMMEFIDKQFCVVCREATTERILELVSPLDRIDPDTVHAVNVNAESHFKLTLVKPSPNTLQVEWRLNGELIAHGVDGVVLDADQTQDFSTLTATIFDSTATSRRNGIRNVRTKTVNWSLRSRMPGVFRVLTSKDTICAGDSAILNAYGCSGTLSWSTGETAAAISVKPAETAKFNAYCKVEGKSPITSEVMVTVLPLPAAIASNTGPYLVGETIELTAQGGNSYEWIGPRSFSANTANTTIREAGVSQAGVYEVKVTDVNGCTETAQTEVKVDPILSVPNDREEWVRVSPNPATDHVSVETALPGKSTLVLYDQSGRELVSKSFLLKTEISLRVPAGIYLYRFTNGAREATGKMVVQ